jgi:hypothetical protein
MRPAPIQVFAGLADEQPVPFRSLLTSFGFDAPK